MSSSTPTLERPAAEAEATQVPTIAGGFTIPTSPRRKLQQIQRAELEQTPGHTGVAPPPAAVPTEETQASNGASEQMRKQANEQMSIPANAQTLNSASEQVRGQASQQVSKHLPTFASEQVLDGASARVSKQVIKQSSEGAAVGVLLEQKVRDALAARRIHPGGTKASVDMDTDLMRRAKQYLLDHGEPAMRILFIELLTAFLEKEGY